MKLKKLFTSLLEQKDIKSVFLGNKSILSLLELSFLDSF